MGVEPADAGDLAVRANAGVARRGQGGLKPVKVVDQQRRVRLARGRERLLDTEMKHCRAGGEPAAAPDREDGWLYEFGHLEQSRVEGPCRVLAPARHCQLNVVDSGDHP